MPNIIGRGNVRTKGTPGGTMLCFRFFIILSLTIINFAVAQEPIKPANEGNQPIAEENQATTDDPLELLKQGNQRFVENKAKCDYVTEAKRLELAKNQNPIATLIVCSDSRVPPEQIFDQNVGRLFVIRLAGNVVDQFALASIEYGVSVLKTPLVVIMGHQNCGAVKAAFNLGKADYSANIGSLLAEIYPSVSKVNRETHLSEAEKVKIATQYNVEHSHHQMLIRSPVIRDLVKEEKIKIIDSVFYIDTGKVEWGPFSSGTKSFWKTKG